MKDPPAVRYVAPNLRGKFRYGLDADFSHRGNIGYTIKTRCFTATLFQFRDTTLHVSELREDSLGIRRTDCVAKSQRSKELRREFDERDIQMVTVSTDGGSEPDRSMGSRLCEEMSLYSFAPINRPAQNEARI